MFLSDAQILSDLADAFKQKNVSYLAAYWSNIVPQCHADAYQQIVGELLKRGYSPAQIAAWDRGAGFERNLALFYSIVRGAATEGFPDIYLRSLNCTNELKTVAIFTGGQYVVPANVADAPGLVGSGSADTSSDIFVVPDPNDSRLGQPTRW